MCACIWNGGQPFKNACIHEAPAASQLSLWLGFLAALQAAAAPTNASSAAAAAGATPDAPVEADGGAAADAAAWEPQGPDNMPATQVRQLYASGEALPLDVMLEDFYGQRVRGFGAGATGGGGGGWRRVWEHGRKAMLCAWWG